jgi:hypothetical protein
MTDQPSPQEVADMISVVLDRLNSAEARIAAARMLSMADDEGARSALLEVATQADEEEEVAKAVGQALAAAYLRMGRLLDAPLADFSAPAYLAFDNYVAEHQQQ